jgi:multidrug efflux pump
MSLSTPFIRRPVGTWLLTLAVCLAGALSYFLLPVSPLPQVEFPTINVSAGLPGASPETMASAVATPLERQLGHIAGVTEMTSSSTLGSTNITIQFDLARNIDSCARDVQAAIAAARGELPSNLPGNPTYRKTNPADAPIMILSMVSDVYDRAHMYDAASTILLQKISQVDGVGQVSVGGSSLPAVRAEVNPTQLYQLGLTLADVRTALGNANANLPKGEIESAGRISEISASDQLHGSAEYAKVIVSYNPATGAPVRLSDIASVVDAVEDVHNVGLTNGRPSVLLIVFRQPGANIIDTVDRVKALMPQLQADIPAGMKLDVALDRTVTIRASVRDVQITLVLSILLVIAVVFLFLRDGRMTLIPSVVVPISLVGTFGAMYLMGYSLDNLSLMALTIATGFVVDDAIVVTENVSRHMEDGMGPMAASLKGASEIGFTVFSMSVSLVAVFIPLLLMGGIVGRLFREFAVTLSMSIGISMVISLTTTPMMCATLLRHRDPNSRGWFYKLGERVFGAVQEFYRVTLGIALRFSLVTLLVLLATIALNVYLYVIIPKGLFPQQDAGRLQGAIQTDQSASFQLTGQILARYVEIVGADPDVTGVIAFAGGSGPGGGARMFANLRPVGERTRTKGGETSADGVIARLRPKLAQVAGATLFLQPTQDLRIGARQSNAQYQYTLQGDTYKELAAWAPKIEQRMRRMAPDGILDVNSDLQVKGLLANLEIDRDAAARLNVAVSDIDDALYDAFGQRQVSTNYTSLNQYHVVMEASPTFTQNTDGLQYIRVRSASGTLVPLTAVTKFSPNATSLSINHSGQFPSITLSFNLREGVSLGQAEALINRAVVDIGLPITIHGYFSGTAQAFQDSLSTQPLLIAAALAAVYIVLGILYESLVHPLTIISTLPSAGVGALLALLYFKIDLTVIALIGIILLIGIVKKNAIIMIDFALVQEREFGRSPKDAITEACLLRLRPILMTTAAALLGGVPLAFGTGTGAELRKPLGVAIVGGLLVSQLLTLYTTPVVYLYLDRLRLFFLGKPTDSAGHGAAGHALPA